MELVRSTWEEVRDFDRRGVAVIPTGSLEQHGPHLPLFTDTMLVDAVAKAVERRMTDRVLLAPVLWLGASGHHLAFDGSMSNSMEGYIATLTAALESMFAHGFRKLYVLNGHGGNSEPNGVALRAFREKRRESLVGHSGYFAFIGPEALNVLEGPIKGIMHACEAEASLMLHVAPDLVKMDRAVDDGLCAGPVKGGIWFFDEITVRGPLGYPTLATAEKGKALFDAAVEGVARELGAFADGPVLQAPMTS